MLTEKFDRKQNEKNLSFKRFSNWYTSSLEL